MVKKCLPRVPLLEFVLFGLFRGCLNCDFSKIFRINRINFENLIYMRLQGKIV